MGETFRVSVRELVAFSCFPPDITPAEDAERMLAGGLYSAADPELFRLRQEARRQD